MPPAGIEPATHGLGNRCSFHLGHTQHLHIDGMRSRTPCAWNPPTRSAPSERIQRSVILLHDLRQIRTPTLHASRIARKYETLKRPNIERVRLGGSAQPHDLWIGLLVQGPVACTTALVEVPPPLGAGQLTETVLVGPLVMGGVLMSVQATDPSREEMVMTYCPSWGSVMALSPPTCFTRPKA